MLLLHVTSTGVSMLAPTAPTVTSLPASEAQQFIAVGSSILPPVPPPARILSTSAPLILDTYSPARLMLRGQLDPEVLKLIPLRSVSLKIRMSPVALSRRQTLDPDRTLASGKLSGSRCVLAAFHAHVTREKSTVRVSGFADCMLLAWAVANPPCACAFVVPIGLDDMRVADELTAEGPVGDRIPPSSSSPPHPAVDINSASVIPVVTLIVILPFNLMRWPRFIGQVGG